MLRESNTMRLSSRSGPPGQRGARNGTLAALANPSYLGCSRWPQTSRIHLLKQPGQWAVSNSIIFMGCIQQQHYLLGLCTATALSLWAVYNSSIIFMGCVTATAFSSWAAQDYFHGLCTTAALSSWAVYNKIIFMGFVQHYLHGLCTTRLSSWAVTLPH